MEMVFEIAVTFWQWTIFGTLVVIGFSVNLLDKKEKTPRVDFQYTDMPKMQPVPIATASKGFWGGILMWLLTTRKWQICEDFNFTLEGEDGTTIGPQDQKYMDTIFRDICIEVNGFKVLNYLAFWTLRLAGFVAWNGHKKRGTHNEVS